MLGIRRICKERKCFALKSLLNSFFLYTNPCNFAIFQTIMKFLPFGLKSWNFPFFQYLQSTYRKNHNTESSLLKVFNDILLEMTNQKVTLLVFLDLTAAFDTIDHNILIARLNSNLGISEPALSWFKEYLSDRSQRVSINGSTSKKVIISSGVPQGSCLGPLLFIIYARDLFKVLNKHSVKAHAYIRGRQSTVSLVQARTY